MKSELTASVGAGCADHAVGEVASGAGHTGALLLQASRVGVDGALHLTNSCAEGVNGVVVAGQVHCRHRRDWEAGVDQPGI